MARPTKDGIDYFPLDTTTDSDIKFQYIESKYGIIAFGIIIKIYQLIYGDKGYYTEWNETISTISAAKWSSVLFPLEEKTVNKIVRVAAKHGIFDEEKLNKYGVLTSVGIQKRYLEVSKRRKNLNLRQEYLLISVPNSTINVCNNSVNVCNNSVNVCNNKEKGNNGNNGNNGERKAADSTAPTLSEIKTFVSSENLIINPEKFYYYYQNKRWRNKAEWQSKIREWNATEIPKQNKKELSTTYDIELFEKMLNGKDD